MVAPVFLGYSYEDAAATVGVSVRTIHYEVAAGNIPVKHYKGRTLIVATGLARWFDSLPSEHPKK